MKLPDAMPEELKRGYQAVRTDDMRALPGIIYTADEETGEVVMIDAAGEKKSYTLGARGLRLIERHVRRL